jgi:hypothetical protein
MQAFTIRTVKNGYLVREAIVDPNTDRVIEVYGSPMHVFGALNDATFFVGAKLDVPVGEGP